MLSRGTDLFITGIQTRISRIVISIEILLPGSYLSSAKRMPKQQHVQKDCRYSDEGREICEEATPNNALIKGR